MAGLQEIITYRLTTPEREAALVSGVDAAAEPRVRPTCQSHQRRSRGHAATLLAGLLEVMAQNARKRERLWFFEIGPVYLPTGAATLPVEPRRLGIGMAGPVTPASWVDHTRRGRTSSRSKG